jgi:membrane protein
MAPAGHVVAHSAVIPTIGGMARGRLRGLATSLVDAVLETYGEWRRHRTIRLGAGLAYYGLFSFVPLLAVSLSLAGLFFAQADVQQYLSDQLSGIIGADSDEVASSLSRALDNGGSLVGVGIVGLLSLLFTASLLVIALQDALNSIWERPVREGFQHTVLRRLAAFAVVFACGVVMILSFALNSVSALLGRLVPDGALFESLGELFGTAASWVLLGGVLTLLFRYLGDVQVPWRSVVPGAAITALLVAVGTVAIGAYLRRYAASSLLGATGSVFLVLLWIYYEAQIVLAGAEFTRVLARRGIDGVWASSVDDDGQPVGLPGDDAALDVGG